MISIRALNRLLQTCLLIGMVLALVGCTSLPGGAQRTQITPTSRSTTVLVPTCRVPPCESLTPGNTPDALPGIRSFIDTWNNIHLFLTFDYNITNPAAIATRYDFVWGASTAHVTAFHSSHPGIFLTYYISFFRETTSPLGGTHHDLAYWQKVHPDWVLYKCDRVTPAYAFGDPNVSLDFSNPAVVSWQVQTYAGQAAALGYDGIAADNLDFENDFGACGVYKNGHWVQLYTGQPNDPQWRADIVTWLTRMQQALHNWQHPLALIPNFGIGTLPWNDPQLQQAVSHLDAVLDEEGFTNYGTGYLTDNAWLQKIQFIESVQNQQKPYYIIDQFPSVGRAEIQWALASYLMCKGQTAALYISTVQGYGGDTLYNEYNARIGSPTSLMYQAQNVYWRTYSNGLVVVNPSSSSNYTVTINTPASQHFDDLYGNRIGQTITLPPHSGIVLLSSS